jgi:hypothetical protein
VTAIGNSDASDQAAYRLVHITVLNDFITVTYAFASDYVADAVYTRLYNFKRQQLLEFISASENVGDLGVIRGILYERFAHSIIQNGGTFKMRELFENGQRGREEEITFDQSRLNVFEQELTLQEIGDENVYERPKSKNYESVDSFIRKSNSMFNMTGARYHGIKQVGAHQVMTLMGDPNDPHFYFVVPNVSLIVQKWLRFIKTCCPL